MEELFLNDVARMGREIFKDIVNKHEDGVFLPEVTTVNPNLHKETQALLSSYCDVLSELGKVFVMHKDFNLDAKAKFSDLIIQLQESRSKEKSLFWKTFNLEIGGDH